MNLLKIQPKEDESSYTNIRQNRLKKTTHWTQRSPSYIDMTVNSSRRCNNYQHTHLTVLKYTKTRIHITGKRNIENLTNRWMLHCVTLNTEPSSKTVIEKKVREQNRCWCGYRKTQPASTVRNVVNMQLLWRFDDSSKNTVTI